MDDAERLIARLPRLTHPGPTWQPVHVLYGGADRFQRNTVPKLGKLALAAFDRFAAGMTAAEVHETFAFTGDAAALLARVRARLAQAPIEDLRIDFEDGLGPRSSSDEDALATRAGDELGQALREGLTARQMGLRIRPLDAATGARGLRTLALFLRALIAAKPGEALTGLTLTLPKVQHVESVRIACEGLGIFEREHSFAENTVRLEVMIEDLRSLDAAFLAEVIQAGGTRLSALHLGNYDLTASAGVLGPDQRFTHPLCDHALVQLQAAVAGTHVHVAAGATTRLPLANSGDEATDRARVLGAWKEHALHVRHAMQFGVMQSWDLHPAQLVSRYAALFAFYETHRGSMAERGRSFFGQAARAGAVGDAFDDAATGRGIAMFFARGVALGALDASVLVEAGMTTEALAAWPEGARICSLFSV
jgi:citrate lyase beta subunit